MLVRQIHQLQLRRDDSAQTHDHERIELHLEQRLRLGELPRGLTCFVVHDANHSVGRDVDSVDETSKRSTVLQVDLDPLLAGLRIESSGILHLVIPGDQVPSLKNQPQRISTRGVGVRRLDHVNVWCRDIDENSTYMVDTLGFRVSEQVVGDDGRLLGSWLHVTPKSYDLAYGRVDPAGVGGRLHHVAFAVDAREYVMRAADVYLDAGVRIECGPAKHAVQQTCFLYAFEPGGNRVEVITDGRLLLAPDWPPVTWTMEERLRGQAWGTLMPESWFAYATPPVESTD